jgi:hypothetical protein
VGARLVAQSHARSDDASHANAPPASELACAKHIVELRVPRMKASIVLDGDMDDPGWRGAIARTGAFLAPNGTPARPYSDARLVWGDGHLYVALYAADEDVRAEPREPDAPVWLDDAFRLVFTSAANANANSTVESGDMERTLDVSALGVVTDAIKSRARGSALDYAWQSDAHVSRELDGTLNDARDEDEEWVLELAIPLASLGLEGKRGERIGFSARRCDTPKGSRRVCGSWGDGDSPGVLVLD